jgi:hypothetical protein
MAAMKSGVSAEAAFELEEKIKINQQNLYWRR